MRLDMVSRPAERSVARKSSQVEDCPPSDGSVSDGEVCGSTATTMPSP